MRTRTRTLCMALLVVASALAACSDGPTTPASGPEVAGMDDPKMGVGWVPGTPGECDPWLDLSWCQPKEPGGGCMHTSTDSGITDGILECLPPGGGPGAPPPSEPPPPQDSCLTGNVALDNATVREGLKELWEASNADANLAQRRERAGWIVREPNGSYRVEQWTMGTSTFACGRFPLQLPGSGTVVAFVHTHPYWVDELVVDCDWQIATYTGDASDADRRTSIQLGQELGKGSALPGYILDQDGTYYFKGEVLAATPRGPRCGY